MNDFVIETKQLTKIYGKQTVVSNVSLHVKKGRIYGLLGRNGEDHDHENDLGFNTHHFRAGGCIRQKYQRAGKTGVSPYWCND